MPPPSSCCCSFSCALAGNRRASPLCRILVIEAVYLGMCYLLLDVLQHPPAEVLMGSILVTALAAAIPKRFYQMLARER